MSLPVNLVLSFMLLVFIGCGGSPAGKEKGSPGAVKVPEVIDISGKHIKLPNSHFYIIPPEGFTMSELTQGLQKESERGYGANFVPMTILTGYTTEKYISEVKAASQSQFPGVWKEESISVSGVPAKICRYQAVEGVKMYHLFFLNEWKDQSLFANYDQTDDATGEAMYKALKTVIVKQ